MSGHCLSHSDEPGPFGRFNRVFDRRRHNYVTNVERVLRRPRAGFAAFAVVIVLAVWLWRHVPSSFIPTEDKGYFAVAIQLPDGASLQRTEAVLQRVEGFLRQEPAVQNIVALAGLDILSRSSQTNSAVIFVNVKPWDERGKKDALDAITARLSGRLFGMKDAIGFAFNLPEIPGLGATAGVETNLQDRIGRPVTDFAGEVQQFVQAANQLPAVAGVQVNFRDTGVKWLALEYAKLEPA